MSNLYRWAPLAVLLSVAALCAGCQKTSEYSSGSSYASSDAFKGNRLPIVYPSINPSISDGMTIWQQSNCAACHGADGSALQGKPDLSEAHRTYGMSPIAIYKRLVYDLPKKQHPQLAGKLSNQQIWDLIFYVRSLGHAPLSAQEINDIDPLFVANCSACHGRQGFGDGKLASGLNPQPANFHQFNRMFDRPDSMLFNHMRNGLFPSAMPPWKDYTDSKLNVTFDDAFIRKMVQYVRHFHSDAGNRVERFYDAEKDKLSTPNPDGF